LFAPPAPHSNLRHDKSGYDWRDNEVQNAQKLVLDEMLGKEPEAQASNQRAKTRVAEARKYSMKRMNTTEEPAQFVPNAFDGNFRTKLKNYLAQDLQD